MASKPQTLKLFLVKDRLIINFEFLLHTIRGPKKEDLMVGLTRPRLFFANYVNVMMSCGFKGGGVLLADAFFINLITLQKD